MHRGYNDCWYNTLVKLKAFFINLCCMRLTGVDTSAISSRYLSSAVTSVFLHVKFEWIIELNF